MSHRIYITGVGIISAIGTNVQQTLQSIRECTSGVTKIKQLDTIYKDDFIAGEVNCSNQALSDLLGGPDKNSYFTRTSLLGTIAAREAFQDAGITDPFDMRTGIVSASATGGMDKSELYYRDPGKNQFIWAHQVADSTEKIADYLSITDYAATISTACSSSSNAIIFGARLIKHNILDRVLVGGTDALSKFVLNGFRSLMILDSEPCRPFDQDRKGLNPGEGAGYLVLESEHAVSRHKKDPLCELAGYANTNDAFHQSTSSPDGKGAYMAMRKAVKSCGLDVEDIDYVNAHGTGTDSNDLSEGLALKKIFHPGIPRFSSTKSITGHTFGAAGAIEAVLSVLAIRHRLIYPNLNFSTPMAELGFSPVTELIRDVDIKHVLSNAFGFGGNNSTLIFSRI